MFRAWANAITSKALAGFDEDAATGQRIFCWIWVLLTNRDPMVIALRRPLESPLRATPQSHPAQRACNFQHRRNQNPLVRDATGDSLGEVEPTYRWWRSQQRTSERGVKSFVLNALDAERVDFLTAERIPHASRIPC